MTRQQVRVFDGPHGSGSHVGWVEVEAAAIPAQDSRPLDVERLADAMYRARWGYQWTPGKAQDRLYRKEARVEAERVLARLAAEKPHD